MLRALRVVATGVTVGLLLGILGAVGFTAAIVGDDRGRMSDTSDEPWYPVAVWSILIDRKAVPYWAAVAAAAATNGGIGAWAGWRGYRRSAPVVVVPLLPLLLPVTSCVRNPSDSQNVVIELFVVGFLGLFVWVAGRVAQVLGARQRHPDFRVTSTPPVRSV